MIVNLEVLLSVRSGERSYEPAVRPKLREERVRARGGAGGHDNRVERGLVRLAERAVRVFGLDVVDLEAVEAEDGLRLQGLNALDSADLVAEP